MSSRQRGEAIRSGSSLLIVRGDGALEVVPLPIGDIAGIEGSCLGSLRCRRIRAFARIAIEDVDADEFTVSVVTCEALSSLRLTSSLLNEFGDSIPCRDFDFPVAGDFREIE